MHPETFLEASIKAGCIISLYQGGRLSGLELVRKAAV